MAETRFALGISEKGIDNRDVFRTGAISIALVDFGREAQVAPVDQDSTTKQPWLKTFLFSFLVLSTYFSKRASTKS